MDELPTTGSSSGDEDSMTNHVAPESKSPFAREAARRYSNRQYALSMSNPLETEYGGAIEASAREKAGNR